MADWIGALSRVLDYAKDPNPDHWRTINGSKVHLDENGNYDGGAGGRFNGKHHYGPGWKEQQNKPKRRPASGFNPYKVDKRILQPSLKNLSIKELKIKMQKATNYGDWRRAMEEGRTRLRKEIRACNIEFGNTHNKKKRKEIEERLQHCEEKLEAFRKAAVGPQKFMENEFNSDPEKARRMYEEKKFYSSAFYPAYEKWKAKRDRTTSILKNLANSFKASKGVSIDMGTGAGRMKCYQVADNPDKIQIDKGLGFESFTIKGGLKAFIEKMEAAGYKADVVEAPSWGPEPLPKGSGGAARLTKLQTRASKRGRPLGSR